MMTVSLFVLHYSILYVANGSLAQLGWEVLGLNDDDEMESEH